MELGLVVDPRLDRSWGEALDLALSSGITYVEPCGGGHVPKGYVDPVALRDDSARLEEFRASVESRGLRIAALGCYGNPLHPDRERAEAAHADFVAMCEVAAALGVGRVTVISGVSAAGPHDRVPNWIIPSVYADLEKAYRWQWEERLIPYWRDASAIAAAHGVTICMEPIGGFMVYNAETFLRLREACGDFLCVNLDPSHVWWMGIDPQRYIAELAGMIGYAHAKDVSLDHELIERNGVVPACRYDQWERRSWTYRAVGFGHDELFWKGFCTALRRAGYDDVLSIEIEESFMAVPDAVEKSVELLRRALPRDPIPTSNWFDKYEWESTEID